MPSYFHLLDIVFSTENAPAQAASEQREISRAIDRNLLRGYHQAYAELALLTGIT